MMRLAKFIEFQVKKAPFQQVICWKTVVTRDAV